MIRFSNYDDWKQNDESMWELPVAHCESCDREMYKGETVYEVDLHEYVCYDKNCIGDYFDAKKIQIGAD